jgi:AcrR family transcriptional regulator
MPRTPDAHLRDRILDAASALWHKRGEKSLTLRAVAKAAGTTTPTVYKRFPDKDALVLALATRVRERFAKQVMSSQTLEEAARVYLDMATADPHEYRVAYGPHWPKIFTGRKDQPGLLWAEIKLAEQHGGRPEDYSVLVVGLWMLLHGAASLLSVQSEGPVAAGLRANCLTACEKLVSKAKDFRNGSITTKQSSLSS